MLPDMVNGSRIRKSVQTAFGGYDRRPDAADGTLFDTEGLTTDKTPLIGTREKRWELSTGGTTYHAVCVLGGDQIVWIRNDGLVRTPNMVLGMLSAKAKRSMTRFGRNAIIMPDKLLLKLEEHYMDFVAYANLPTATAAAGDVYLALAPGGSLTIPHIYKFNGSTWDDLGPIAGPLEASVTVPNPIFGDGEYKGAPADMNELWDDPEAAYYNDRTQVDFSQYFKAGDAVTIEGCTWQPLNNQTLIVREVTQYSLRFYENSFHSPLFTIFDTGGISRTTGTTVNVFRGTGSYRGDKIYFTLQVDWEEGDYLVQVISGSNVTVEHRRAGAVVGTSTPVATDPGGHTTIPLAFKDKEDPYLTEYAEPNSITVSRKLPEMDHIFECSNRLWGCKGSEIYASKLGDPSNFYFFDGTADDSWNLTVESPGDFTGAISHDGYPTFFKERERYKVFGDIPSQFRTSKLDCVGVRPGAAQSLAIVDGVLFYLARDGIMADNGATPRRISDALGVRSWGTGVSGGCGDTFAICLTQGTASEIFLYDVARGLWLRDSARRVYGFAESGGQLYAIDLTKLICFGVPESITGWTQESSVESLAETNDFTLAEPNSKRVHRVQMRLETELDTVLRILIQYDGDGIWREIAEMIGAGEKRSVRLPVRLRRCDHFRLRFEGVGGWTLHSLALETVKGSR